LDGREITLTRDKVTQPGKLYYLLFHSFLFLNLIYLKLNLFPSLKVLLGLLKEKVCHNTTFHQKKEIYLLNTLFISQLL